MTVSTLACWHNLSTVRDLTEPRARLQTLHVIFCTPLSGFRSSSASLVSAGFSTATMDQLFCKGEAWGAAGPKWKPFSLSCSHKKTPQKNALSIPYTFYSFDAIVGPVSRLSFKCRCVFVCEAQRICCIDWGRWVNLSVALSPGEQHRGVQVRGDGFLSYSLHSIYPGFYCGPAVFSHMNTTF